MMMSGKTEVLVLEVCCGECLIAEISNHLLSKGCCLSNTKRYWKMHVGVITDDILGDHLTGDK